MKIIPHFLRVSGFLNLSAKKIAITATITTSPTAIKGIVSQCMEVIFIPNKNFSCITRPPNKNNITSEPMYNIVPNINTQK
jgi:hypothetical protein